MRPRRPPACLVATLFVLAGACGDEAAVDPNAPVTVTVTPAAGGTLQANGLTVTVPAGAVSEDIELTATPLAADLDLEDDPGRMVGPGWELTPDLWFDEPVTLEMAYDPDEVVPGNPASIAFAADDHGGWQLLTDSASISADTLRATTEHFSVFAPVSPDVCPMQSTDYILIVAGPDLGYHAFSPPLTSAFDASGRLLGYTIEEGHAPSIGDADVLDLGGAPYLRWGRWNGGTLGGSHTTKIVTDRSVHYLAAVPATLPDSGTIEYAQIATTGATYDDGSFLRGAVEAAAAIGFDSGTVQVGLELTIVVPEDTTYEVQIGTSELDEISPGHYVASDSPKSKWGAACDLEPDCKATLHLIFAGPDADALGVGFTITSPTAGKALRGVVGLARFGTATDTSWDDPCAGLGG